MKINTFEPFDLSLKEIEVPNINSDISILCEFALSFNGYKYVGGLVELGGENGLWDKIVPLLNNNELDKVSVEDIRACLFWVQRNDRWHQDYSNVDKYLFFIEKLREKLNI
jgi:hypothetical protein